MSPKQRKRLVRKLARRLKVDRLWIERALVWVHQDRMYSLIARVVCLDMAKGQEIIQGLWKARWIARQMRPLLQDWLAPPKSWAHNP